MFNQLDKAQSGETIAIIKTNHGEMRARLFPEIVGESAENFIKLAQQGKYDNVPFHRIIKGFMIQGGDFLPTVMVLVVMPQKATGCNIGDCYDARLTPSSRGFKLGQTSLPNSIGSQFLSFILKKELIS